MTHRTGVRKLFINVMRHAGCYRVDRLQLEGIWRETFASTAISHAINSAGPND
jgi:hypothetical protein